MKPASLLAALLFGAIALAHLFRLALGIEVTVAGRVIPRWISAVGAVVPLALAVGLWRERRRVAQR